MPYAALGVGLAIVMTVGLSAVAGIMDQPTVELSFELDQPSEETALVAPAAPPEPAPPSEAESSSLRADEGMDAQQAEPMEGAPEVAGEQLSAAQERRIVAEPHQGPDGLDGLYLAMPYVAAGIVGAVVFVVVRKKAEF